MRLIILCRISLSDTRECRDIMHFGSREQTMLQLLQRLRSSILSKKKESIRETLEERNSLREHGSGKKNTAEQSFSSLKSWDLPVIGTESALQWMKAAMKLLLRSFARCTRKAISIRVAVSLTGVLFVRLLFLMQRLSTRSRQVTYGTLNIL